MGCSKTYRLNGKYAIPRKGHLLFINLVEEGRLAAWLVERAKRSFALSIDESLDSVKSFL